jgi:hypothetical protein
LPDLAELYDRRRPELDWREDTGDDRRPLIPLPARPLDEDLRSLGSRPPRQGRPPIGEPTMLDRGQQALRHRLAQPGHMAGLALRFALPFLFTALVATGLGFVPPLSGTDQIPLATVVVIVIVAVLTFATYAVELVSLGRVWLVLLVTLGSLMPLLALQSTFSGIPYVSADRSSAEPVIMTGIVIVIVLIGIAIMSASLSYESPGDAAVLFLPAALIVPVVMMGPASDIPDRGLASIVSVSVAAAIAAAGSQFLPERYRVGIGVVAVGVVLGAMVAAGRGPELPRSSGQIVDIMLWFIVGLAALLTVVVPLLAYWLRHVEGEARLVATPPPGD